MASSNPLTTQALPEYGSLPPPNPTRSQSAYYESEPSRRTSSTNLSRSQSMRTPPSHALATSLANPAQIHQMREAKTMGLDGYKSYMNILAIFVPISFISAFLKNGTVTFITSFIGMIPLAMVLGRATEDIAEHTNETVGALVNVTFGNAVELILSISALQLGKLQLIRDTITGSILSNLLLVLGSSFFFGGLRFREQEILPAVSEANADLLSFSVFGLSIPALYAVSGVSGSSSRDSIELISLLTSIGLLIIYVMYIYFQLFTHSYLYSERGAENGNGDVEEQMRDTTDMEQAQRVEAVEEENEAIAPLPWAVGLLLLMVLLVTVCSELLVRSIDSFSERVGLNERFLAMIILPVVGNAVEHMSAIMVAVHGKIDLSIGIACGSSVQIALFAAPALVVISWLGNMDRLTLDFDMFPILCIGFSVFIVNATMRDSRTNWLEGAVLVMCYLIISAALFLFKDG